MKLILKVDEIISHQTAMRQAGRYNYPSEKGLSFIRQIKPQLKSLKKEFNPNQNLKVKVTFIYKFPKSYSIKKRNELKGTHYPQKPDLENTAKLITDLVFRTDYKTTITKSGKLKEKCIFDDSKIVDYHINKFYNKNIEVKEDIIIYELVEAEEETYKDYE